MSDRFLTVQMLLERWDVDRRTLDKLVEGGLLPCVTFPVVKVRRFALSDVERFEQKHQMQHDAT